MTRNRNLALLEQLVAKLVEVLETVFHFGQPSFESLALDQPDEFLHAHDRSTFPHKNAAIVAGEEHRAPPLLDYRYLVHHSLDFPNAHRSNLASPPLLLISPPSLNLSGRPGLHLVDKDSMLFQHEILNGHQAQFVDIGAVGPLRELDLAQHCLLPVQNGSLAHDFFFFLLQSLHMRFDSFSFQRGCEEAAIRFVLASLVQE